MQAVSAFTANEYFYDVNEEHGSTVWQMFTFVHSLNISRYLPVLKTWLKRFSQEYLGHRSMLSATNEIMVLLWRGHNHYVPEWREQFISETSQDTEFMEILRDLALSDWTLGTSAELIAENAGRELSRFIQYDTAPIHPTVVSGVRSIFDRYSPFGEGAGIYISAAESPVYFEKCSLFDICNLKEEVETRVLSIRHDCPSVPVTFHAQGLTDAQLVRSCRLLAEEDQYFHETLKTGHQPVEEDWNTRLTAVVFKNSRNYEIYSGFLFGNDTNNGGIYLEGDPSEPDNTPRFLAYIADWISGRPIWNLEHEYVHYLDGRFNMRGAFRDYGPATVAWAEGLAEYISLKEDNERALALARNRTRPQITRILKANYDDSIDFIYRWSYFAVRFLFERHFEEIEKFRSYLRAGSYDDYARYAAVMEKYDDEFEEWLSRLLQQPIELRGLDSITIGHNDRVARVNLAEHFFNFQDLGFTVSSSDSEVVSTSIRGNTIFLTPHTLGEAEIGLTVHNGFGPQFTKTFMVTVAPGEVEEFDDVLTIPQGSDDAFFDLRRYFVIYRDQSFTASSSQPGTASVLLSQYGHIHILNVRPISEGGFQYYNHSRN